MSSRTNSNRKRKTTDSGSNDVDWRKYRKIFQDARDQSRKTKVLTELNLVRDAKGNKKRFSRYIGDKRKTR